jgi:hypothetical protein
MPKKGINNVMCPSATPEVAAIIRSQYCDWSQVGGHILLLFAFRDLHRFLTGHQTYDILNWPWKIHPLVWKLDAIRKN